MGQGKYQKRNYEDFFNWMEMKTSKCVEHHWSKTSGGKFMAIGNICLCEKRKKVSFHLKKLEKEEQTEPKINIRK